MSSEGARLCQRMNGVARACSDAAILEARRLYGGGPCVGPCSGTVTADPRQETPLESDLLQKRVANCFSGVIGHQVVPSSVRTQGIIQSTLTAYADPTNPESRFVAYRGPVILAPCPPIPTAIVNANIPKSSKRCPLPNKGYNPNLPA
jgi:hypothetical protein